MSKLCVSIGLLLVGATVGPVFAFEQGPAMKDNVCTHYSTPNGTGQ